MRLSPRALLTRTVWATTLRPIRTLGIVLDVASHQLPADNHVHTQWSWDARAGSMFRSCERAIEIGLPAIAFTEHFDLTRWVTPDEVTATLTVHADLVDPQGYFNSPPLDVEGYQAELEECRSRFPELRIVSGVELGEPHWFRGQVADLLSAADFERVLGSQHSFLVDGEPWIVSDLVGPSAPDGWSPSDIVRAHLLETADLIRSCDEFGVLAHVDYAVRHWTEDANRFPFEQFEEEFRLVLETLADSDRVLEVNTVLPMSPVLVGWWYDVGGKAISFGSDAHRPEAVAHNFREAAAIAEHAGFRPNSAPHELWIR